MEKTAVLAITKNGIKIGKMLKSFFPSWKIFAPIKFSNNDLEIEWYEESTSSKIVDLFKTNDSLVCLFSLGAVFRLIAPHLRDKKTDPAIIVIDDKTNFVISALSGHLGGANELTVKIAKKIDATPVITTAADVNKTIAVDLVGREYGWKIEDDSTVTKVSAFMVNEEKIGVFQDSGIKNWWKGKLPKNVKIYQNLDELERSDCRGFLIITDKKINSEILKNSVVYRPPSLVVGIGLHWNTSKETVLKGLEFCLKKYNLSSKSVAKLVSMKKDQDIKGLIEAGDELSIPVEYVNREDLAKIEIPNPSDIVRNFERTPSVSEAAALKVSNGNLIIEKQKFPPDLTIAIARVS